MESKSVDWEAAYESAGLWPVAVELPLDDIVYLLWYQRRKDHARVVTSGGRAVIVAHLAGISGILQDSAAIGIGDQGWDAVRRLAAIAGTEVPDESSVSRRLVGQSLEWLQILPEPPTQDQTEELLNCLDLFSEWHRTLRDDKKVGRWPASLDGATSILSEAVLWGAISPAEAFERVSYLGLWPVMERVTAELMDHTVMLSYRLPAA